MTSEQRKHHILDPIEEIEHQLEAQEHRLEKAKKQKDEAEHGPSTLTVPEDMDDRPDFGTLA